MKVKEIAEAIEAVAPLYLQEDFDNAGMQVGDLESEVDGALLCTDVTEEVVDEAVERGIGLVISHHPLIFHGIKKIIGRNRVERIVAKALRHGVSIYSAHTSLDNARGGVNYKMAEKLGMTDVRILEPQRGTLRKLVVYVPTAQADAVEQAMHAAGAGHIGDYDSCSYRLSGEGRYRALEGADPWAGEVGEHHVEPEVRVEVIMHKAQTGAVLRAMLKAHPYEEPAFDVIPLDNADAYSGSGVVGSIKPMAALDFLRMTKEAFGTGAVRYSATVDGVTVSRVALCGGAGSFLVPAAIASGAQVMVTGDVKYHEFQDAAPSIILADIGHYESEHFTKEIFCDIIKKKNPNFAIYFAHSERNQVNYL